MLIMVHSESETVSEEFAVHTVIMPDTLDGESYHYTFEVVELIEEAGPGDIDKVLQLAAVRFEEVNG
jgi:hypothetical protein